MGWRGGRAVYGSCLENSQVLSLVGSNPSLSALAECRRYKRRLSRSNSDPADCMQSFLPGTFANHCRKRTGTTLQCIYDPANRVAAVGPRERIRCPIGAVADLVLDMGRLTVHRASRPHRRAKTQRLGGKKLFVGVQIQVSRLQLSCDVEPVHALLQFTSPGY